MAVYKIGDALMRLSDAFAKVATKKEKAEMLEAKEKHNSWPVMTRVIRKAIEDGKVELASGGRTRTKSADNGTSAKVTKKSEPAEEPTSPVGKRPKNIEREEKAKADRKPSKVTVTKPAKAEKAAKPKAEKEAKAETAKAPKSRKPRAVAAVDELDDLDI